jgi:hypothetical protein
MKQPIALLKEDTHTENRKLGACARKQQMYLYEATRIDVQYRLQVPVSYVNVD